MTKMFVLKLILKVIAFPVMLIVTILQWFGAFLVGFSAAVFNILYTFIEKRRARITQKLASKSGDPNKKKRRDSYTLEAYIGMGIRKAAAWIKNRNKAANHKSKEREKS